MERRLEQRVITGIAAGLALTLGGGIATLATQVHNRENARPRAHLPAPRVSATPTPGALPTGMPDASRDLAPQVLPLLDYPIQDLGYQVVFDTQTSDVVGETNPILHQITIHVRPEWNLRTLALVTAHEVGHAAAVKYMTPARQQAWLAARGGTGAMWYPCTGCPEHATGVGDYADVFTLRYAGEGNYTSTLAPEPTKSALAALEVYFHPATGSEHSSGYTG